MSRISHFLALAPLLVLFPGVAGAQLTELDRERLAGEIQTAATQLDPSLFPDLDQSQQRVVQRADAVKEYLGRRADPANREAWLAYLKLDPLVTSITQSSEPNQSLATVARESIDLRYRLIGTAPGLELSPLRQLRQAVEQLIEAIRFRDKERATESLAKQLESFAERVRQLDANPSADDLAVVSALLGVLQSSGQAQQTVQSLRDTFNRPNVAILVGEPMVQTAVGQNVDQTRPVRDCILGTRIVGTATLNGVVTANLLPSVGTARIEVSLAGHLVSNSIGYNGPVRLHTVGQGDVNVTRMVNLDDQGFGLEPAYAHAVLRTEIQSIEHPLKLVRKIAWKKAGQQKPKADRIAVEKMRQQVGSQFATQTREATATATPEALADLGRMLQRLSLEEPARSWSSTDQTLFIDATFRRHDQISSVVSRPSITEPYDVAVQIHESAVDNALSPVLAGRTMSEAQLNKLLENSGRRGSGAAAESSTGQDEEDQRENEPFEIDFARLRPIIFEARDQTVRVGVRGTRFSQGGRELTQAMEITAVYEPTKSAEGIVTLVRKGDVDVDFPGRKRLSVSQAGLKRTIQKKFAKVFPETLLDRPLEVPTTAAVETLQGRVFQPRLVDSRDGWLSVGVK